MQVEQEVAIGHRVERVGNHPRKAQGVRRGHAVERIRGPRERGGAQRRGVGGLERRVEPLEIAGEHPVIREQMVRQQHGLGMLQVRHAGQDRVRMLLRHAHQRLPQG